MNPSTKTRSTASSSRTPSDAASGGIELSAAADMTIHSPLTRMRGVRAANVGMLDGHVEWRDAHDFQPRTVTGIPTFWW